MQVFELPSPDIRPESLGFSPDGRLLAAWDRRGRVLILNTATGAARALGANGQEYAYCTPGIGFTAGGREIVAHTAAADEDVASNRTRLLRVHDTKTGNAQRKFPGRNVGALDVGANGLVVFGDNPHSGPDRVVLWDTRTGKRRCVFNRTVGFVQQLAVSADGNWVAESCVDLIRVWDVTGARPAKRAKRQFRSNRNKTVKALAVSAAGEYAAATSVGLYVWDVRTGRQTRLATPAPGWGREIAFHPSGPVLAYRCGTDEVAFRDAAAGAEVRRFAWKIGTVSAIAFSQDGLRCAAAGEGKVVVWDVEV